MLLGISLSIIITKELLSSNIGKLLKRTSLFFVANYFLLKLIQRLVPIVFCYSKVLYLIGIYRKREFTINGLISQRYQNANKIVPMQFSVIISHWFATFTLRRTITYPTAVAERWTLCCAHLVLTPPTPVLLLIL